MPNNHRNLANREKSRVLVVDDHPIVREHLSTLIAREPDLVVIGQADSAHRAIENVRRHRPELVILDLSLADKPGLELIKELKAQFPDLLILVLSMHDETLYAERVLRAGARGYIMKEEATRRILDAIRRILGGDVYLSTKMAARALKRIAGDGPGSTFFPVEKLSDRELEVFQLIGQGYSTRQIGATLSLDVKTVETYRSRIKDKLNLDSGSTLVRHAIQWVHSQLSGR
jgi:DNA-binding NarL/FixJ family response regulator